MDKTTSMRFENNKFIFEPLANIVKLKDGTFKIESVSWDNGKTWIKPCNFEFKNHIKHDKITSGRFGS